jgi:hypothetical protein
MVAFIAGDVVSASALRDALGALAVLQSDVTVAANTVQQDCPGLAVSVDAYSRYTIEGYIAYNTGVAPEIRFGLTAPPEAAGTWLPLGIPDGTNANTGDLIAVRREAFNVGTSLATEAGIGGSGSAMAVPIVGRMRTFRFAGVLQLRFAQLYSDAAVTTVNAGSWLRVQKIESTL